MNKAYSNNLSFLRERNIYIGLFLVAFAVVIYRAIFMPLFVDELATYTLYVKNAYFSPYNEFKKANNHIVNTLLTYVSYSFFGNSPISLRLFNVLAFIPFGIYIYKIGSFFTNKITKWAFYLAFLFSLNFIAYFSLSRGYGLSFTFMVVAIYYNCQSLIRNKITDTIWSVLSMGLALYSNFSLLLFVCILGAVLLINVFLKKNFYLKKKNLVLVILAVCGYIYYVQYALKILFYYKEEGLLWWGGLEGFWQVTVYTLMHNIFNTFDEFYFIQILIIFCSVLIGIISISKLKFSFKNIFFFLFFLNVLGIILMAHLFEVNYPYQRTGVHLYVFFIGAFCFSIDQLHNKKIISILLLPMFLIPVHFVVDFNTSRVVDWEEDNLPHSFYQIIKEIESNQVREYIPSIHIEGTAIACWDFNYNNDYQEYMPHIYLNSDSVKWFNDYIIDRSENVSKFRYLYDSITTHPNSRLNLYKRKKQADRELIKERNKKDIFETKDKYKDFIHVSIDSNASSSYNVELKVGLEYHKRPFYSIMVFSVVNAVTNEKYNTKTVDLHSRDDWRKGKPFVMSCCLNNVPLGVPIDIKAFIMNVNEVNFKIHGSNAKVYSMIPEKFL